ncbi:hypothetical protein [Streptomyces sp. NPDC127039]|uniref:hypothetical protein n=1 Tax=Streptomyces sp. NPDC127039 TaxID=3347115 RepID=UPI0036664243
MSGLVICHHLREGNSVPEQDLTVGQLLLAEYESVKGEQKARICVRDDLGPRPAELAGRSGGFTTLGWEAYHRRDTRRRSRKAVQTVIDLTAFGVVPLAALTVFRSNGDAGGLLIGLSVLEALVVAGLASQVAWYTKAA